MPFNFDKRKVEIQKAEEAVKEFELAHPAINTLEEMQRYRGLVSVVVSYYDRWVADLENAEKELKKKLVKETLRYDVSVFVGYDPKVLNSKLKKLNITQDEFDVMIREYTDKRKIFFFVELNCPWDEIEFKIGNEVQRPIPR